MIRNIVSLVFMANLIACNTINGSQSSVSTDLQNGEASKHLFSLDQRSAEALYTALNIEAVRRGFDSVKHFDDQVAITCVENSNLKSKGYNCSADTDQPLFRLSGYPARKMFESLEVVPKRLGFETSKDFSGRALITCVEAKAGASATYKCDASTPEGPAVELANSSLLSLKGEAAKNLFGAMSVDGIRSGFSNQKRFVGLASLECVESHESATLLIQCEASSESGTPVFRLGGESARELFAVLAIDGVRRGFQTQKVYEGNLEVVCTEDLSPTTSSYHCDATRQ